MDGAKTERYFSAGGKRMCLFDHTMPHRLCTIFALAGDAPPEPVSISTFLEWEVVPENRGLVAPASAVATPWTFACTKLDLSMGLEIRRREENSSEPWELCLREV